MKILLYGIAKDIVGSNLIEFSELETIKTVGELRKAVILKFPEFAKLSSLAVAVDEEYAQDETQISSKNEIALIPPVSGG